RQCQDPVTVHLWSCLELRYGSSTQNNGDFQPQLYGRRIAKVGCNATLGRIEVVNKIVSEFMKLQGGRSSEGHLRHRCSLAIRAALVLPAATMSLAAGCGNANAAPATPTPEVEVA